MATLDRLERALVAADAAGDDEAVSLLAAEVRRLRAEAANNAAPSEGLNGEGFVMNPATGQMTSRDLLANHMQQTGISRGRSAVSGGARGVTFGGIDEATGAINAAVPGAGTPGERYAFGREWTRAQEDAARDQNPVTFGASEIGGGVATALGYAAPAMAGRGLGGAALAGAGTGAVEGGLLGALSAEGGAAERAEGAATYGLLGAGLGAVAPYAVRGAQKAAQAVADPVAGAWASLTNSTRQGRANRALASTVERSGRSVDEIDAALRQAASEGQPEYRVADALGSPGQRQLSALQRSGGDSAAEIKAFLDQRQLDQPDRVGQWLREAFDGKSTADMTRQQLTEARNAVASKAYAAAREGAGPVDVRGALAVIDDRIGGMQGSNVAGDSIDGRLATFRRRLAADTPPKGETARELSDFSRVLGVKQDVGDAIGAAQRAGRGNEARELMRLRDALDEALESASPAYRAANDDYARASRAIDAVDIGKGMARPGRYEDNVASFQRMAPDQQGAARVGYGDQLLQRVEGKTGNSNRALPLTSTKARKEATAIARDPDLFARRIGRESEMFETRARATGGSLTADNQADAAGLAGVDQGVLASLLRLDFQGAGLQAAAKSGNALTGLNDSTRRRIADALLAKDTKALTAAIKEINEPQAQRVLWNAIARSGLLRGIEQANN